MSLRTRRGKHSPGHWIVLCWKEALLSLISSIFLFSCSPNIPVATPELVTVYSTYAAQPWLPSLYACAELPATISRVDDPAAADIALRIGEPEFLDLPTFQIDTEEILVVTHRRSPVQNLTLDEARSLFAGQKSSSVQVWVYGAGEDVQDVFDRAVMAGSSVTPSARIAVHPQQMSDTLVNESDAIGILPRHWKLGEVREVLTVATVPVLAITSVKPEGIIRELIACVQR